jgi:hypothetical protein
MNFSPVVTGTYFSVDKGVWSKELILRVHGSWFKIDEDGSWEVSSFSGLDTVKKLLISSGRE